MSDIFDTVCCGCRRTPRHGGARVICGPSDVELCTDCIEAMARMAEDVPRVGAVLRTPGGSWQLMPAPAAGKGE